MVKVQGTMINFINSGTYKGENGEVPTKAKLQIMFDVNKANGDIEKKLFNISIPDDKISQYKDKVNKEVIVDVAIISQAYSFYGI